ncbi:MAG: hypothetical protein LC721_11530 [Actinobacteria bacterium]|nr:hypothetical protein [Actinomycetota bacterium]
MSVHPQRSPSLARRVLAQGLLLIVGLVLAWLAVSEVWVRADSFVPTVIVAAIVVLAGIFVMWRWRQWWLGTGLVVAASATAAFLALLSSVPRFD